VNGPEGGHETPRLVSLHLYPVKGLGGIRLDRWPVGRRGLAGDRCWMLTDSEGGFLSQRKVPAMATVRPTLVPAPTEPGPTGAESGAPRPPADPSAPSPRGEAGREAGSLALHRFTLLISAPRMAPLELPLRPSQPTKGEGAGGSPDTPLEVEIWGDRVQAVASFPEADHWFSKALGRPCRAVFLPDGVRRNTDPEFAPGHEVGFADGYPFLLTSVESLADLNRRLPRPVPMDRFRANLVVQGGTAHAEDTWQEFRIGDVSFQVVKPCARCVVTTVDQESGKKGPEPLRTLATYRKRSGKVYFGQNLVHDGEGLLEVGAPLRELSRRDLQKPSGR
jgi:uncharacterized protein